MSSHHFVKEGQEPALFILGPAMLSDLHPVLEWSPLVIVHETMLDAALQWAIKIDVVVTEKDTECLTDQLDVQGPVKILTTEKSTLETVVRYLKSIGQSAVAIAVQKPTTVLEDAAVFADNFQVTVITASLKWSLIRTGSFTKWFPEKTSLSFHGLTGMLTINGHVWKDTSYLTKLAGIVEAHHHGPFWVGEPV
jgi:hypothetical protein